MDVVRGSLATKPVFALPFLLAHPYAQAPAAPADAVEAAPSALKRAPDVVAGQPEKRQRGGEAQGDGAVACGAGGDAQGGSAGAPSGPFFKLASSAKSHRTRAARRRSGVRLAPVLAA
jgi:hypothetical protein